MEELVYVSREANDVFAQMCYEHVGLFNAIMAQSQIELNVPFRIIIRVTFHFLLATSNRFLVSLALIMTGNPLCDHR